MVQVTAHDVISFLEHATRREEMLAIVQQKNPNPWQPKRAAAAKLLLSAVKRALISKDKEGLKNFIQQLPETIEISENE